MAYNTNLADRVRIYLSEVPGIKVDEKTMFRGLAFLVNDKMCINVSGENLMCRIDPQLHDQLSKRRGFMPMIMKGKEMNGYCYVKPEGFKADKDFDFWIQQCLHFNPTAKASKKAARSRSANKIKTAAKVRAKKSLR